MLRWLCFKVWIVHELDCITNVAITLAFVYFLILLFIFFMCQWRTLYCWLTTMSFGGMMSHTSVKFTPLWNVLLTAGSFVIFLLPSRGSGTTLSTIPSGNGYSKQPHEHPANNIFLHVLGLILQMIMIRGDPGNCQVTLDHLTLATVLPALCHGLMYVSVSLPCLFPLCVCVSPIFIWFFHEELLNMLLKMTLCTEWDLSRSLWNNIVL